MSFVLCLVSYLLQTGPLAQLDLFISWMLAVLKGSIRLVSRIQSIPALCSPAGRPDLPQVTPGEETGKGRSGPEHGPPRAGAVETKSLNKQRRAVRVKPHAQNHQEEAKDYGGNEV